MKLPNNILLEDDRAKHGHHSAFGALCDVKESRSFRRTEMSVEWKAVLNGVSKHIVKIIMVDIRR
jgi:hypothetical protein